MSIPVGPPPEAGAAAQATPSRRAGAAIVPEPTVRRRAQAAIAVLAVAVLSLGATILARPDGDATDSGSPASSTVTPTGETTEVTVRVDGMSFTPDVIAVPAGNALTITFENTGDQRHDLVLGNGAQTAALAPGASAVLDAGVIVASLEGWCSLPGHRAMGMELRVSVVGASGDALEGQGDMDHGGSATVGDATGSAGTDGEVVAPSMAALRKFAETVDAVPAELPPLTDATHHEYTFEVTESSEGVTDGVTRAVWTFNGSSPGPTLHGRVGDTFEITLVNHGSMGHSIDFHAGELAPDVPMRTIEPGESLVYAFTADRAGMWMYHCSTMPMSQHIANGMFGAVVIEPREGLGKVDREYVMIQSEIYLGEDGGAASATKAAAMEPDVMAFNGRAFQYAAHPLQARVGERVRFWVLAAGPSLGLSFHVVGGQFDTVWTEGAYSVLRGESADGLTPGVTGAQVLPLLAAQGGFVEMVAPEAGHYAIVNHQMALAEKGAQGVLEVTEQ